MPQRPLLSYFSQFDFKGCPSTVIERDDRVSFSTIVIAVVEDLPLDVLAIGWMRAIMLDRSAGLSGNDRSQIPPRGRRGPPPVTARFARTGLYPGGLIALADSWQWQWHDGAGILFLNYEVHHGNRRRSDEPVR